MNERDTSDIGDLTKLRARMVACLDELDSLSLPALAAEMALAISQLDSSILCPQGVSIH